MKELKRLLTLMLCLVGLTLPGRASAKMTADQVKALPAPATHPIDFAKEIKPILESGCINCHGRGKNKGGLALDSRQTLLRGGDSGAAVVPGRSAESYFIELVAGVDPENVMPQKGSRLSPAQVGLLRAWIDQGLPWPEEVSFAKVKPANLTPHFPAVPLSSRSLDNPIDALLEPYFASHKVRPGGGVEDRTFARRVYQDLIGLNPTPKELQTFLNDRRPDKRALLVRRLLGNETAYADHWLTFWNDALRNDYRGTGFIDGGRKQISGWLYSALATNMPFDRFVSQLLDPIEASEGYTKGIVWRGVVNASQIPPMQAAQNVSQLFLGINLKCASCHDSFINDWTLADAYGLANVFAESSLEIAQCDKLTGRRADTRFLFGQLGTISQEAKRSERLGQLAKVMTGAGNGRLPRTIVNRLWARFMGRGLVEPLDDMNNPAWHPALLDWLAEDLVGHGYNLRHTMERIVLSRAYALGSIDSETGAAGEKNEFVFRGPQVRRLSAEQFRDALGNLLGVWYDLPGGEFHYVGEADQPTRRAHWIWSTPAALTGVEPASLYLRKQFHLTRKPEAGALAITCDNGFTVYLNGQKLGEDSKMEKMQVYDIGARLVQGLNVLAVLAVNAPPKETNAPTKTPAGLLVQGRLAWGDGTISEVISDSTWLCSPTAEKNWENPASAQTGWAPAVALAEAGGGTWKFQTKYEAGVFKLNHLRQTRSALVASDPLLTALGRPNREQVITSRQSAATTLEALELTNGEGLSKLLHRGAENWLRNSPGSGDLLLAELYWRALGRAPSRSELKLAQSLAGQPIRPEGLEDFLWTLSMLPEFQLIY